MNINRVWLLFRKEITSGTSGFLLIFALVMPIVMTFLVTLIFGSLFSEQARLGVVDAGDSQLAASIATLDVVDVTTYETEAALRSDLEVGVVDIGLLIPADFDATLQSEDTPALGLLIWGQSLAQDRAVLNAAINNLVNEQAGVEVAITINTVSLGDSNALSLEARLLPLLVLMAVIIGGTLVPAGSLVEEKQKRTLRAVTITPATLSETLLAKGLLGWLLSLFVGVFILLLNDAFGTQPELMIVILALGAMLSSSFGILLGLFIKDTNALFASIKGLGILLYAPAFVYLFPDIPISLGQVFPTYYIIAPIMQVTQEGAGFADIAAELGILVLLIGVFIGLIGFVIRQPDRREALAL